jgi:integration host factor subunit beta
MTRSDLVEELAARFEADQRDAELAVKTILDAVSDALVRGQRIEIRGFGSFSVTRRPRWAAIPAAAKPCRFPPSAFPISSPARRCAKPWTTRARGHQRHHHPSATQGLSPCIRMLCWLKKHSEGSRIRASLQGRA